MLIRSERNSIPVYFVTSLLEMSEWGDTDDNSLKNGFDSIFAYNGSILLSETAYEDKVIDCTADCAIVNFGHISGLMKRLSNFRDWLITFHCVNLRVELAVKGSFKTSGFGVVDDFYAEIFNLLKDSGKFKGK